MKTLRRGIAVGCVVAVLLSGSERTNANPIEDFFKRLGHSIAHPQKKPPPHRTVRKDEVNKPTTKDAPVTVSPSPTSVSPTPAMSESPNRSNVRAASAAPPAKGGKRDVPYGIPVPGKKGFVSSPFAPDEGYIDVRGFAPGTEVKDPYTGKIFLTP